MRFRVGQTREVLRVEAPTAEEAAQWAGRWWGHAPDTCYMVYRVRPEADLFADPDPEDPERGLYQASGARWA